MARHIQLLLSFSLLAALLPGRGPAQDLQGRATDPAGRPAAGARVTVYAWPKTGAGVLGAWGSCGPSLETGGDGTFAVPAATLDMGGERWLNRSRFLVAVSDAGIGLASWQPEEDPIVRILLDPFAPLSGTVVDEKGGPVVGALVQPYFSRRIPTRPNSGFLVPPMEAFATRTDEQGAFLLERLPAGEALDLLAAAAGRALYRSDRYPFPEGRPQPFIPGQRGIRIVLPPEAVLAGTVVDDAKGAPIPGLRVGTGYTGGQATTGPDGSFRIGGLAAGKYTIQLYQNPGPPALWLAPMAEVELAPGETRRGVVLVATRGVAVELFTVDEQDGTPICGAWVQFLRPQAFSGLSGAHTGQDGLCRLRAPAGECRVVIHAPLHRLRQEEAEGIAFRAERDGTARIVCRLRSKPGIDCLVRDEAGNPLAGIQLQIYPWSPYGRIETGPTGKVRLTDLTSGPEGQESLLLLARGPGPGLAGTASLVKDQEAVAVTLRRGGAAAGRAVDSDGRPVFPAVARLSLRLGDRNVPLEEVLAATDGQGRFRLEALPWGQSYEVVLLAAGYEPGRAEFSLPADGNGPIELGPVVLEPAIRTVAGRIVDEDGEPVAQVRIYALGPHQPRRAVVSDDQGRFRLDRLPPGTVQVLATLPAPEGQLEGRGEAPAGTENLQIVLREARRPEPQPEPITLAGKPIPDLSALGADLRGAESKRLLVLLWDPEQRPSRRTRRLLGGRQADLATKGILVVELAATPETMRLLGARGLPWLILTDGEHRVRHEGFGLDELDGLLGG